MMNLTVVILFSAILFNLFLLGIVYWRAPRKLANYLFLILVSFNLFWVITNLLAGIYRTEFWVRIQYAIGAVLIGSILIWISYFYRKKLDHLILFIISSIALFFFILSLKGYYIINQVQQVYIGRFDGTFGFLFPLYIFYIFGGLLYLAVKLYRTLRGETGVRKMQVAYVLFGILIFGIFSTVVSFILPFLRISSFSFLDVVGSLCFLFSVFYAIVRYRFMHVRSVITRSLLFSIMVLIVSSTFTIAVLLVSQLADITDRSTLIWVNIGVAVIVVLFLNPLRNFLGNVTDKIFFKGAVDHQEVAHKLSDLIAHLLERDELLNKFAKELKQELKLKKVEILFCGDKVSAYSVYHSNSHHQTSRQKGWGSDTPTHHGSAPNSEYGFAPNNQYHQIIKFFTQHQEIKVTEEEERKIEDLHPSKYRSQLNKTVLALSQRNIAVVAPVAIKKDHKITALIFLGDKNSGDIFDNRDIRLLELLRSQLASALEKSGLYEEVKAFARVLEKKVKDRTLELREANARLRQLDKAKTLFLSIASHQLRTPLTGIRGFLSMILQGDFGTGIPAKARQVIEEVYANTTRLIRLVATFLNVSRIEAGHLSLMKAEYDLIPMAQKTVNELKFEAQSKGLKLSFECSKKKIIANIDADKIEDVLVNLTDNAVKYTAHGWVRVRLIDRGDMARFEVQDTGQGLKQGEIKTLFNKFVRGDRAPVLHTDGSGLGLFIAKRIVEMHKGKIGVQSPGVGKGSTFWFEVPKK